MAKRYSAASDMFLESTVKRFTSDGKVDWSMVIPEVREETGKSQTLGAIKIRYSRLVLRDGAKRSSRGGDKTLGRMIKWILNLLETNSRATAQRGSS